MNNNWVKNTLAAVVLAFLAMMGTAIFRMATDIGDIKRAVEGIDINRENIGHGAKNIIELIKNTKDLQTKIAQNHGSLKADIGDIKADFFKEIGDMTVSINKVNGELIELNKSVKTLLTNTKSINTQIQKNETDIQNLLTSLQEIKGKPIPSSWYFGKGWAEPGSGISVKKYPSWDKLISAIGSAEASEKDSRKIFTIFPIEIPTKRMPKKK